MPQPGLEPDSLCRRFGPSLCLPITPLGPPETEHNLRYMFCRNSISVLKQELHFQ
jgi:hypothetical protein